MRDYVSPSNSYTLSLPGLDAPRMPPPSSTNGSTLSDAMLTDPKILKKHFTNGMPVQAALGQQDDTYPHLLSSLSTFY